MSQKITRNPTEFKKKLWNMKNKGKYCDAFIIIDGPKSIPCHKVIMGASSSNLLDTFITLNETTINGYDIDHMESFIEYCYSGTIAITNKNVQSMIQIANLIRIPSLVKSGFEFWRKSLNSENCLSMWSTAEKMKDEKLKYQILQFIKENFDDVVESEDFLNLYYSELKEIFNSEVKPYTEMTIYEAIKKWVTHDTSRFDDWSNLLHYAKLECLPKEFLLQEVQLMCNKIEYCPNLSECYNEFISAIKSDSKKCPKINNENTLIVMGGDLEDHSRVIEIFNLDKQKWKEIECDDYKRTNFTAVFVNKKLMIIGGGLDGIFAVKPEYYDLKTNQFESLPEMNYPRLYSSSVTFGESVYTFGGKSKDTFPLKAEKWMPKTKKWDILEPMKLGRFKLMASVLDGEIFVVGGSDDSQFFSETEAYNPTTNKWRTCSKMNEKRSEFGMATVGAFIYAVGGLNESYLNTAEKYDKLNDKWTVIGSLDIPRGALVAGNLNGRLLIMGGHSIDPLSLVEEYNEKDNTWKKLSPLKSDRYWHCVIEVPWRFVESVLTKRNNIIKN